MLHVCFFEGGCPFSKPKKSHCPCFEKQFKWFHNVQFKTFPLIYHDPILQLGRDSASNERRFLVYQLLMKNIEKTLKTFLPENKMPQSFDIWYVTATTSTLQSLLKIWLCGQNGLILKVTEFALTHKLKT